MDILMDILMDIFMPSMDGVSATRKILEARNPRSQDPANSCRIEEIARSALEELAGLQDSREHTLSLKIEGYFS